MGIPSIRTLYHLPWRRLALWAIFFAALAVRLWKLADASLWFDETMSVYWAKQGLPTLLRLLSDTTLDPHPPLYYLLLSATIRLLGDGDVAVRLPSVIAGAALVWPIYGIGRLLWDGRLGLIAAALVALNPFLAWYGQEARMYALAVTLGAAALYFLLRQLTAFRRGGCPKRSAWAETRPYNGHLSLTNSLAFVVCQLAALYTYLLSAAALPVAAAWALLTFLRRPMRRRAIAGGIALAVVAVGFAPLALSAWQTRAAPSVLPGGPLPDSATILRNWLGVWFWHKAGWPAVGGWAVGALALAGVIALPGRSRLHLATYLLLPLAAAFVLARRDPLVLAETRYFIVAVPPLLLALAALLRGLWARWQMAGLLALLLALGLSYAALRANWSPEHRREDWRAAAQVVAVHATANDAIVVHVDYMQVAFRHYYRGPLPVYFPFHDRLSDMAQVAPPLAGLAGHDTLWLVQSHTGTFDPDHLVERWLGERYPLVTEQYPAGITVKGYALRTVYDALPDGTRPLDARFGTLQLAGCQIMGESVAARNDRLHPPSGWLHARLFWQATEPLAENVTPVTRLIDATGQVWGERLERADAALRRLPPTQWPVGSLVRLDDDVNLNPATPPGDYRLIVTVQDGAGQTIPAEGADTVAGVAVCGPVRVTP